MHIFRFRSNIYRHRSAVRYTRCGYGYSNVYFAKLDWRICFAASIISRDLKYYDIHEVYFCHHQVRNLMKSGKLVNNLMTRENGHGKSYRNVFFRMPFITCLAASDGVSNWGILKSFLSVRRVLMNPGLIN